MSKWNAAVLLLPAAALLWGLTVGSPCPVDAEDPAASAKDGPGYCHMEGIGVQRDEQEDLRLILDAANQGDVNVQTRLAGYLLDGKTVPGESTSAENWFRKAAEAGHAPAQYKLGNLYEEGHTVPRDIEQAAAWYEKAAAQGLSEAKDSLRRLRE